MTEAKNSGYKETLPFLKRGSFRKKVFYELQIPRTAAELSRILKRTTNTWKQADKAVKAEVLEGATEINLQTQELTPGSQIQLGEATVTLIAGWGKWTRTRLSEAEDRNVISIVARLTYKGNSILLTGDTIGRRLNDPSSACKDAEKVMVENANRVPVKAEVLVAPHHGGNNGSANCFIQEVKPKFVILSAGHRHDHPSSGAVNRYLS